MRSIHLSSFIFHPSHLHWRAVQVSFILAFMPTVRFPALMKFYVDNQTEFPVAGATVAELIANVVARYPTLKTHLFEPGGNLRRHFNIFVNGEHIRELNGMETVLKDDDKVVLMVSAAGG
jgi:sulfur-carrier protein